MIVEDDVVNRNILKKRLSLDGHVTLTVTNGQEAVELIGKDRAFDCIFDGMSILQDCVHWKAEARHISGGITNDHPIARYLLPSQ